MFRSWKRIGTWCGIVAGIQFIILTIIIMLFYPVPYLFLDYTFSSLGLSVTFGIPTPQNWFLFATATTLAGALSVPFWLSIRTQFDGNGILRVLSWVGTILGVIAAPCLAGIGIFAADLFGPQHGWSTIVFFILFALAIGLYSVVILLNKDYENVYALVGIIASALNILYVGGIGGIFIGGAAMQKVAVYGMILYSVFQGYKLLKVFEKK